MSNYSYSHEALCLLLEERDCQICRLKEELAEAKQSAANWEHKHRWARPSSWESDMVSYYKSQLAEAKDNQTCVACDDFQGYKTPVC